MWPFRLLGLVLLALLTWGFIVLVKILLNPDSGGSIAAPLLHHLHAAASFG